eukprot:scpid108034/ scgid32149/ 
MKRPIPATCMASVPRGLKCCRGGQSSNDRHSIRLHCINFKQTEAESSSQNVASSMLEYYGLIMAMSYLPETLKNCFEKLRYDGQPRRGRTDMLQVMTNSPP